MDEAHQALGRVRIGVAGAHGTSAQGTEPDEDPEEDDGDDTGETETETETETPTETESP